MLNTSIYISFFLLFCFFLQFSFDAIQELFRQIQKLFRNGNYSGRYRNCSDMGIIQAVTGNIQADEVQNYVFFLLFVCSLIFGIYAEHSYFFIILLFLQFLFDTIWELFRQILNRVEPEALNMAIFAI
jgi:hypothetical protein